MAARGTADLSERRGLAITRRIVVTGPPGSGKTPLAQALAAHGFGVAPEPAREVIAEQRVSHGDAVYERDPALFVALILERAIADYEAATGPTVFDRAIPDHVGYAELFGLDPSAAIEASHACRYDDPVFVLPSWPEIYVTDDDRKMTFEQAQTFGDRVREIYTEQGYALVDVPKAPIDERAAFIIERLDVAGPRPRG